MLLCACNTTASTQIVRPNGSAPTGRDAGRVAQSGRVSVQHHMGRHRCLAHKLCRVLSWEQGAHELVILHAALLCYGEAASIAISDRECFANFKPCAMHVSLPEEASRSPAASFPPGM